MGIFRVFGLKLNHTHTKNVINFMSLFYCAIQLPFLQLFIHLDIVALPTYCFIVLSTTRATTPPLDTYFTPLSIHVIQQFIKMNEITRQTKGYDELCKLNDSECNNDITCNEELLVE